MENGRETDILTVTTTVGSRADGERLARELLQRRLAACVQLEEGITSFYRWKGALCEDPEVRLTIKTAPGFESRIAECFRETHPYELPQLTAAVLSASEEYSKWVRDETQRG
jgi:periplasmic divalent cation tolerance protein